MSAPLPAAVAPLQARRSPLTFSRVARLALKELRETLRDRRTIVTLVLMPVLVYPLLSLAFRQFLLTSVQRGPVRVRIGVASEEQHHYVSQLLKLGNHLLQEQSSRPDKNEAPQARLLQPGDLADLSTATFEFFTPLKTTQNVQDLDVDVAIRIEPRKAEGDEARLGAPFRCDIWYHPESTLSRQAADYIEQRLRAVNEQYVRLRLQELGDPKLLDELPAAWQFVPLAGGDQRPFWLASLVPLVLIVMTITGAVYPAIDLTAGERERGTLESLMAAPVPRLGLLIAKYIAVVSVAMLTAVMNLVAMTITVATSGLGPMLFGEEGLSIVGVLAVFALLILFAAFFSAVLLSITSFARSFKEAQAYLIPLMLVSLAPGFLSVMPGLELNAPLSITPLANIVLLARDILEGHAPPLWTALAILSTLLYGALALAVAAQIFGSDSILYGSEGSWGDLFHRHQPRSQATIAGALAALAVVVPLFILLGGVPALFHESSMTVQLLMAGSLNLLIFLAVPLWIARWQSVAIASGFQLRKASGLSFLGALVLGCSLAPLVYELIIASRELGVVTLTDAQLSELMQKVKVIAAQWRDVSPLVLFVPLAIVPAICEEWFFRGYLLGSLRGRVPPWIAIGATAIVFGLFHASLGGMIIIERVLPSTVLGLVLGWLCWTSRSVLPGMLLHAVNNGLLLSLAYWEEHLKSLGLDVKDQQHLPLTWVAAASAIAVAGLALAYFGRRSDGAADRTDGATIEPALPVPAEPNAG